MTKNEEEDYLPQAELFDWFHEQTLPTFTKARVCPGHDARSGFGLDGSSSGLELTDVNSYTTESCNLNAGVPLLLSTKKVNVYESMKQ